MEHFIHVVWLAIIQGITEFLPVSSSGHLVLSKHFLGITPSKGVLLEIVLNTGTLFAILVFYWKRLFQIIQGLFHGNREAWRFSALILLGCLPAILIGVLFKKELEGAFSNPRFVSCTLMGTGLFLIASHFAGKGTRSVGWISGFLIGILQAVALLPGVSRSGSTIGMSRFLKIEPKQAAEYSFFMLIPLSVGACLLAIKDVLENGNHSGFNPIDLSVGFIVSAVVGYFSLKWLIALLQRGQFWYFGIYCLCIGGLTFFLLK
jgi:undecaprenyl-diphosphatase